MARTLLIAGLLIPLVLCGGGALAGDSETDQLREQLRATVLQLRQLQDQQAAAPAPTATPPADDVTRKLAAAQAQLRAARRDAKRAALLQAALDKAQADNTALTAAGAASAAEIERLKTAYGQSVDAGRTVTGERDRLKSQLAQMTLIAGACQAKNGRLVAFAESLLEAYRKVGIGEVLAAREPVLGLRRVQLENIAQDREDSVRAVTCDPRLDAAPPAKPAGG